MIFEGVLGAERTGDVGVIEATRLTGVVFEGVLGAERAGDVGVVEATRLTGVDGATTCTSAFEACGAGFARTAAAHAFLDGINRGAGFTQTMAVRAFLLIVGDTASLFAGRFISEDEGARTLR